MPSDCMRNVIIKNIQATNVRCFCTTTELGARLRHGNRLSLLMIDAEGFDDAVLFQFPFEAVRPARVIFEAQHLQPRRFYRLARYLRTWGYEMLGGTLTDYISTWHHANSSEVQALFKPALQRLEGSRTRMEGGRHGVHGAAAHGAAP